MSTTLHGRRPGGSAIMAAFALSLIAALASGTSVSAHTAFAGSTPSDGATLDAPVSEILIEFTNPAEPAGDGFVVLDPSGEVRSPTVSTDDDKVFRLAFDTPLTGGTVGVRWSVRAGDAHPIEGSFSFTVTAEAPAPTTTSPTTTEAVGSTALATTDAVDSTIPAATEAVGSPDTTDADASGAAATQPVSPTTVDLEEFLRVDGATPGEGTARVGRVLSISAAVLAIGGLAFAATALRGSGREIVGYLTAIRIVGAVLVVGALVEYVGVARLLDETWSSAWSRSAGAATLLRALAGVAIAVGLTTTVAPRRRTRSLSAAAPSAALLRPTSTDADPTGRRWSPDRSSLVAFVGAGLAVISFWFDGHTVTKGFRPLHALANSVHVVAGSVWVAGVVSVAVLLWIRHRAGRPSDTVGLVVRFSSVATVSLGAVVVAGLVMAIAVLDSFDELTSTQWGQTLLLKTAAVGVAAAIGAFNHFRLRPALEADPNDVDLLRTARSTLTSEAIILGFVVVVTAWLVAAAS